MAAEDVLQGDVEGVPDMQVAGDVGRRDDDGIAACGIGGRRVQVGGERFFAFPAIAPAFLGLFGFIPLGQGGFVHDNSGNKKGGGKYSRFPFAGQEPRMAMPPGPHSLLYLARGKEYVLVN